MNQENEQLGLLELLKSDYAHHGSLVEALFCLGYHATILYRIAHCLHTHHLDFFGKLVQWFGMVTTGADISRKAIIGPGLSIFHPSAILIGPGSIIGKNCILHQGCALVPDNWTIRGNERFPVVEDQVYIGAGAKIMGGVTVGFDSRVAPNSVVLKDVPPSATALGVPARMIHRDFRHDEPDAPVKPDHR